MILIAFGTRPEYIKLKCLIDLFDQNNIEYKCIFVGQHSKSFIGLENTNFDELIIEKITNNRLNQIVIDVCTKLTFPLNTKLVLVQGDTATSFAVALAAYNNGIKVGHIEAGLRTWDLNNPYPEEGYRRMIDAISTYHFCPTGNDFKNVLACCQSNECYITGNTVIDTLPDYRINHENEVYVTLHRRENHEILQEWILEIEKLAVTHPSTKFFFIKHPNPKVLKHIHLFNAVSVIDPLPHEKLLDIVATRAKLLITDSGGLQEEASHYNKFCLVCRRVTERPSESSVCVEDPRHLSRLYDLYKDHKVSSRGTFGFGKASQYIFNILKEEKLI